MGGKQATTLSEFEGLNEKKAYFMIHAACSAIAKLWDIMIDWDLTPLSVQIDYILAVFRSRINGHGVRR